MTTRIIPTFLLKGLNPNQLLIDYQSGFFSRQSISKSKIAIVQNKPILAPVYGTTNHSSIFTIKDKNNCSIVIATTGHADFEVFTTSGGKLPTGGRCDLCKEDFTETAVGYPVGYKEITVLTNDDSNVRNARYRIIYAFWVEKRFCTFECALGYVRMILVRPSDYRDTTIRDAERLLKTLHKLMYPNSGPLRPAQDPSLLIINGGSLTKEQWQDQRHVYIRTNRVLMIPAKIEYDQQKFSSPAATIDHHREMTMVVTS
jgi:hypothetical protein